MSLDDRAYVVLDGREYRWKGWYGCQLENIEPTRLSAGTVRHMAGRLFRVFRTERRFFGLRGYKTAWSLCLEEGADANKAIHSLKEHLQKLI